MRENSATTHDPMPSEVSSVDGPPGAAVPAAGSAGYEIESVVEIEDVWGPGTLLLASGALGLATGGAAFLLPPAVAAAAGAVAAAGAAALFFRHRRVLRREYLGPIAHAVGVMERFDLRAPAELRAEGAPLVRSLVQSVVHARAAMVQRERLSQANLMSVESAFDRIHAVLQSLGEGVVLVDAQGRVILANACARRIMLSDGRPFEGREVGELLPPRLARVVRRGLDAVGGDAASPTSELSGLQVGSRYYDIAVVRVEGKDQSGTLGTVISLIDVTRNHEIARLKEEFLSSISHELRTPLTNICAFTEILEGVTPNNDNDWREFLGIVQSESQRLMDLVDDILQHSRLMRGEKDVVLEHVDVGEVMQTVTGLFGARTEASGVELQVRAAADEIVALGDHDAMRQVLSRLVDNALKFTPAGGTVVVGAKTTEASVEVFVEDSGRGIPAEYHECVFEGFRQIGDHMTDKPSGAGLGLSICRSLVNLMGGHIWCSNAELGGARLTFVVPRAGVGADRVDDDVVASDAAPDLDAIPAPLSAEADDSVVDSANAEQLEVEQVAPAERNDPTDD